MWVRLRQIAVVTEDLRSTALDIGTVLGVEACYCDPGVKVFGLKNTLWAIGTQFLEVVTPVTEGTAGGRYLQRRGGDSGYMVIGQVDDIDRRRRRAEELGIRVAWQSDRPERGHRTVQLHPADTGGTLVELDQMVSEGGDAVGGPWWPAGRGWEPYVRTDIVGAISAAEIQSPDPASLARRWAELFEHELGRDAGGNQVIQLDNAALRFVADKDGRGEGLGGIDVVVNDRGAVLAGARARGCYVSDDQVMVGGLRVNLC